MPAHGTPSCMLDKCLWDATSLFEAGWLVEVMELKELFGGFSDMTLRMISSTWCSWRPLAAGVKVFSPYTGNGGGNHCW